MTTCGHCGAALTPADLSMPSCRYCGAVQAHYARAAEKVAVVNALMGDANRNGIPDALEGLAVMGGAPPMAPPGGPLPPGAHAVVVQSSVVIAGGALPPLTGGPVGGPMSPMYAPDVVAHARRGANQIVVLSVVITVAIALIVLAAVGAGLFFAT